MALEKIMAIDQDGKLVELVRQLLHKNRAPSTAEPRADAGYVYYRPKPLRKLEQKGDTLTDPVTGEHWRIADEA